MQVNASALAACGLGPASSMAAIASGLRRIVGLRITARSLDRIDHRAFPTTWAKRIGYGREPPAWIIEGQR